MVGGLGSFDAVLDRVSHERADTTAHGSGPWTAMRGWNSSFVSASFRAQPWPSREQSVAAPSVDDNDVSTPTPTPMLIPAPRPKPSIDTSLFKRLSPEEVAKDINLLASDTPAELQSKRRSFARLNHPDRTPMEWRDAATTRMKIANHLVDEALRRI
jgi:hypothetical protein